MFYIRLRLIIWALLLPLGGFSQGGLNLLPVTLPSAPIIESVQYHIDLTDRLTVQQLTDKHQDWQPAAPGQTLMAGFTPHPVWYRITLRQSTGRPTTYALSLTNWYTDSVTLYQPLLNKRWQPSYAGNMVPFARREPPTRYPTFYVHLANSAPQTYFIRVFSAHHHNYKVKALVRSVFDKQVLPDRELIFVLGVYAMQIIFHLSLLVFMFKVPVLRAYALFSLVTNNFWLFSSGFPSVYFPQSTFWAIASFYGSLSLFVIALSYYVVNVFQLTRNAPRLVTFYWLSCAISLLFVGLSLVVRNAYVTWIFMAWLCLTLLVSLLLIPIFYWRGLRLSFWYILPLISVVLPYAYVSGRNSGLFGGNFLQEARMQALVGLLGFFLKPFFVMVLLRKATRAQLQATRASARADAELIQEQNRMESLRQLDVVKTNFFTNISHELRTPLTLLVSPLLELRERFPTDALYDLMHRNAQRLLTLTNQLLDLARLDAGHLPLNRIAADLANDLRIWTALFDSQAQGKSIHFTLEQQPAHWPAYYDADKLGKIMTNLIANALKFTPDGGAVTVRGRYQPDGVTLVVSDTGIGIAPDVLPFIFDRFYQVKQVQQPLSMGTAQGTGIGLALINELINLKGGTIAVTSEPGVCTTFTVALPIRPADQPLPAHPTPLAGLLPAKGQPGADFVPWATPVAAPEADMSHRPLVLLVEDNDDLRIYLRMVLAPTYQVIEASDGQQGLELALDCCPDLVLTDLMIPRLDGLALCRALRADLRTNHIPVVMLTAKAVLEDRLVGLETGADDYLTKPFVPTELHLRIRNLLRRQAAVRAFFQRSLTSGAVPDSPPEPAPEGAHQVFIDLVYGIIDQHLSQPDFNVEALAAEVFMSSRNLNRKLSTLVGLSARELISSRRLQQARGLLQSGELPTNIAEMVGFGSLPAFSRAFKAKFGYPPSMAE